MTTHLDRTCVGCHEPANKTALLRIVALGDELVLDPGQHQPGRASYVHRDAACIRRFGECRWS